MCKIFIAILFKKYYLHQIMENTINGLASTNRNPQQCAGIKLVIDRLWTGVDVGIYIG
jgi:hypothetical protein